MKTCSEAEMMHKIDVNYQVIPMGQSWQSFRVRDFSVR
jgi:hypothetical protein